MKTYKPHESIKELFDKLKKDFKIYAYKDNFTWFFLENEDGIAYIQKSDFSGYDLSSQHKPCHEVGTGYGVLDNVMDISKEEVETAIVMIAPVWERSEKNRSEVVKYKSFEDYLTVPSNSILNYKQV